MEVLFFTHLLITKVIKYQKYLVIGVKKKYILILFLEVELIEV